MESYMESAMVPRADADSKDEAWCKDFIASSNIYDKESRYAVKRTSSSDSTWDQDKLPLPESIKNFDTLSAPVIASDLNGKLHLAISASDSQGTASLRGGLFVLTSKSGDKWEHVIHLFNNNANAVAESPSIACDTTEMIGSNKNPYRNRIYAAWVVHSTENASSQFSEILFAESVDGGNTFVVPVNGSFRINPIRLNTGKAMVSNPNIEVDQYGQITVSWNETNPDDGSVSIVSRSSSNGGEGFGPARRGDTTLLDSDKFANDADDLLLTFENEQDKDKRIEAGIELSSELRALNPNATLSMDESAIRKIAGVLTADHDPDIRQQAADIFDAFAVAKHHRPSSRSASPIFNALRISLKFDRHPAVRTADLFTAAEFNSDEAEPILKEGLTDIDSHVRDAAEEQIRRRNQRLRDEGE